MRLALKVVMHNDENVVGAVLLYSCPYTRHEGVQV